MRRYLTILAVVVVVAIGGVLAVVFTAGATSPKATGELTTPQAVLKAAAKADRGVKSGEGTFTLVVTPKASSGASGPVAAFLGKPITIKGSVGVDAGTKVVDATFTVDVNGMTMDGGLRWIGDKGWVQYAGTWYELPPQVVKKINQAMAKHQSKGAAANERKGHALLKKLDINPRSWLNGLSLVGTESIDSVQAYHVTSGFNVKQISKDLLTIVKSPEFKKLAAAHAGSKKVARIERRLSQKDVSQIPAMAGKVVRDPRVDVWVNTANDQVKQIGASATIVPPANQKSPVESVKVEFTGVVDQLGQPVKAVAPTDVHPWSELQKSLKSLQQAFKGMSK